MAKRSTNAAPKSSAWPASDIEQIPIDQLKPSPKNARTHSQSQVLALARSMEQFGWTMPVLRDDAGFVIAGHGRLLAAGVLVGRGLKQFAVAPAMTARGWSEAEKRAYTIADNALALQAGWDPKLLETELKEISGMGFPMELLGFPQDELRRHLGTGDDLSALDESPGLPPANPVSRRGDLWICGPHRVLCGDCRSAVDVARVMGSAPINVAITSPPYAEQRAYDESSEFKPIPPGKYVQWFKPVAQNIAARIAPDGSWFVNIKPSVSGLDTSLYVHDLVAAHVREWGWHFATEFCWERNGVPKSVTQRFKNQFEPIYQFARGRWKMRPDNVRHDSKNVPRAGGKGVGDTSWATAQGGNREMFGAAKRTKHVGVMAKMQGVPDGPNVSKSDNIGPGLAYPGNRLPTFTSTHTATGHTAAFPVGLPDFFIRAFSDEGDVVFDPFLGSGSTLIAADHCGRVCMGCEISPSYVDIIVARWQKVTGLKATLSGRQLSFEEIEGERKVKPARSRKGNGVKNGKARAQAPADKPAGDRGKPRAPADQRARAEAAA